MQNFISFYHHGKIQRNLMIEFQENTQTDARKMETLFHRILPATAKGLTSTTAVEWNLKAKDKKCDAGLTKYYASQSACKKSAIHKLIQQIL